MCNKLNKRTVIRLQYRIKEYREKLKMSQAELSEKAKVSRTIISGLESGSITVTTTETLLKIAKALGKNVSDIFFETNVWHVVQTEKGVRRVKRKPRALRKRLSALEVEVHKLKVINEILFEFCRSVANKDQLSLLSYQQLNGPVTDSNEKVRMLLDEVRKF